MQHLTTFWQRRLPHILLWMQITFVLILQCFIWYNRLQHHQLQLMTGCKVEGYCNEDLQPRTKTSSCGQSIYGVRHVCDTLPGTKYFKKQYCSVYVFHFSRPFEVLPHLLPWTESKSVGNLQRYIKGTTTDHLNNFRLFLWAIPFLNTAKLSAQMLLLTYTNS